MFEFKANVANALSTSKNNFTVIRVFVASMVVYYHAYPLILGRGFPDPLSKYSYQVFGLGLGGFAVAAFFTISGFLITSSMYHRQNILPFLKARAIRLYPAIIVCNIICILFLGLFVTSQKLIDFFLSPTTWSYFLTNSHLLQNIQYRLPGVFEQNAFGPAVNGSLWTIVIEVKLYLMIALFGLIGVFKRPKAIAASILLAMAVLAYVADRLDGNIIDGSAINPILFCLGSVFFILREKIPLSPIILIVSFCLYKLGGGEFKIITHYIFFSYFVIFISLYKPNDFFSKIPDISYGVYIYAFPIQQTLVFFLPDFNFAVLVLLTFGLTICAATISWYVVEKPMLKLK